MSDERFIAKTKPKRQDIMEHTDDLLRNFKILYLLYPNLNLDWDMLYLACVYHDLGKMNSQFQEVMNGKGKSTGIPHGILSLGFIDVPYLKEKGYSKYDIKVLFHAVGYHHDRNISKDLKISMELEFLKEKAKEFEYSKLPTKYFKTSFDSKYFTPGNRIYEKKDGTLFNHYVMLKGMLNRIDYAASAGVEVEHKNDFLLQSLEGFLQDKKKVNPSIKWNELQQYMMKVQENNVIIIAQTGMGKTEAGLLWIGNNKGLFTLPLKSAINAIYERVTKGIVYENIENRIGLLHSDTVKVYMEAENDKSTIENSKEYEHQLENYYQSTKQLSLPLTICTLDQLFDFVYRYRGFEVKLATLSYSKIVIDEIQMYSSDLVAYLILGLKQITKFGGKYAILTATLPKLIWELMQQEGLNPPEVKTFTNQLIRHSVKVIDSSINNIDNINEIVKAFNNNKILVICNTVKRAKEVYGLIKQSLNQSDKSKVHLLHGAFIRRDRNIKENRILKVGKNETIEGKHEDTTQSEIWITTQIVEASLDIDFDLLFTELSDLNGLFQRMGRCYRHRPLNKIYNCFVFTGGNIECSGVGKQAVIDPDVFRLSKDRLLGKNGLPKTDGMLSESDKIKMIEEIYTTNNLKDSNYYNDIINILEYVDSIVEYELNKTEVIERFRNIQQTMVIPYTIYEDNKKNIKEYVEILNNKSLGWVERNKAKESIRDFMLPVNNKMLRFFKADIEEGLDNPMLDIEVIHSEYNDEMGISFPKSNQEEFKNVESRMF